MSSISDDRPVRAMIFMPWGRVGSNVLFAHLAKVRPSRRANEELIAFRDSAEKQLQWLEKFFLSGDADRQALICSKQSFRCLADPARVEAFILDAGIRVIRMFRKDMARTAISAVRARQYADRLKAEGERPLWGVEAGAKPLDATRIETDELGKCLTAIEREQGRLRNAFLDAPHFDIEYEDFARNMGRCVAAATEFLGLEPMPFAPAFEKATPDDVSAVIENYEEVAAYLAERGHTL